MAKGKLTPPPPEDGNRIAQDLPETEAPQPEENEDEEDN